MKRLLLFAVPTLLVIAASVPAQRTDSAKKYVKHGLERFSKNDIAGAIACHRHTRCLLVTAAVDGLQFLHPIKVGDLIILRSRVTCTFTTSLEVEVEVFSEETLTGVRRMTSRAYLTFVAIDRDNRRIPIPGLILETAEEKGKAADADRRRAERLKARKDLESRST